MLTFANKVVKQAKLMMALNKGQIDKITNSAVFQNVGIMMLIKNNNSEKITHNLLKNSEIANDTIIVSAVNDMIQEILNRLPDKVKEYYGKKTIGELLKKREEEGTFKQKMDQITEYVKEQFINIVKKYSNEYIDDELKNWKIK